MGIERRPISINQRCSKLSLGQLSTAYTKLTTSLLSLEEEKPTIFINSAKKREQRWVGARLRRRGGRRPRWRGSLPEAARRRSVPEAARRRSVPEPTMRRRSVPEPTLRRRSVPEPTLRRRSVPEPTRRRSFPVWLLLLLVVLLLVLLLSVAASAITLLLMVLVLLLRGRALTVLVGLRGHRFSKPSGALAWGRMGGGTIILITCQHLCSLLFFLVAVFTLA